MKQLSKMLLEKLRINKETKLVKKDPISILKDFFKTNFDEKEYELELKKFTDKAVLNITLSKKIYTRNIEDKIDKWLNKNDISNYAHAHPLGVGDKFYFGYTFYVK